MNNKKKRSKSALETNHVMQNKLHPFFVNSSISALIASTCNSSFSLALRSVKSKITFVSPKYSTSTSSKTHSTICSMSLPPKKKKKIVNSHGAMETARLSVNKFIRRPSGILGFFQAGRKSCARYTNILIPFSRGTRLKNTELAHLYALTHASSGIQSPIMDRAKRNVFLVSRNGSIVPRIVTEANTVSFKA